MSCLEPNPAGGFYASTGGDSADRQMEPLNVGGPVDRSEMEKHSWGVQRR